MKRTLTLFLAAAATMLAAIASADTYAVIIGINDYPEPLDANGNRLKDEDGNYISEDLRGCVNDAKFWQDLLKTSFGVKESNIHMLLDGAATEANFLKEIQWLAASVKPGDRVFFSYSGHGSQIALPDQPEEADGLTEVICLIDSSVPDNFFAALAKDFRDLGVEATLEFDSCHSGGIDRDVSTKKWVIRNKWIPTNRLNAKQRSNHVDAIEEAQIKMAFRTTRAASTGSYAFVMASQEDQPSSDLEFIDDTPPQGAFTFMVKLALESDPKLSIKDLIEKAKQLLIDNDFKQRPKAEYSDSKRPAKPLIG
jgi:hypothetical protein